MLLKLNNKYRQRGIGLLELMLSLAIISLLLIMATRYFAIANRSQQVASVISSVQGIRAAVVLYVAKQGTRPTNIAALVTEKVLPDEMAGTKANPWGGAVELADVPPNYTVTFESVPVEVCAILLAQLPGDKVTPTTCTAGKLVYTFS